MLVALVPPEIPVDPGSRGGTNNSPVVNAEPFRCFVFLFPTIKTNLLQLLSIDEVKKTLQSLY